MPRIKEFEEEFSSACDAVLITDLKNVYYFTGYFPHSPAYLLFFGDGDLRLLVPELEHEDARQNATGCEVINLRENLALDCMVKIVSEMDKIKTIGFESDNMTVSTYLKFMEKLKSITFKSVSDIISKLREAKTQKEIEFLEKAAGIADLGVKTALDQIEEGKTESDVAGEVEYQMRKAGSQKVPFDTIIASGPNGALPHATVSERKIQRGDLIIIDLGATYGGYCSDMTRTVCFGKPSDEQLKIYELVLKAHLEVKKFARAGASIKDLDELAREMIKHGGHEFIHSLGHGVGLDVHERPNLSYKNQDKLVEYSIITIEPGIYVPGFGGVRIEDVYLVLEDKVKNLTKTEQEIFI